MNRFRLSSTAFERETEAEKVLPKKVFFISVEGNVTEKEYLQQLSKYREQLGIDAFVNIEVLQRRRSDTYSAPTQVVELLEEYLELRNLPEDEWISEIPNAIIRNYGEEILRQFLEDPSKVCKEKREKIYTELTEYGYDLSYRKYLRQFNKESDEFCVLIDRDSRSHSERTLKALISHCQTMRYNCYISNPCFEFWLLLHLSNVSVEYADRLKLIQENRKVSNLHTFVSKEVSCKAHHGKGNIGFATNYLPNIDKAISHAKRFASDTEELVDHIGCNIWKLIESMRAF